MFMRWGPSCMKSFAEYRRFRRPISPCCVKPFEILRQRPLWRFARMFLGILRRFVSRRCQKILPTDMRRRDCWRTICELFCEAIRSPHGRGRRWRVVSNGRESALSSRGCWRQWQCCFWGLSVSDSGILDGWEMPIFGSIKRFSCCGSRHWLPTNRRNSPKRNHAWPRSRRCWPRNSADLQNGILDWPANASTPPRCCMLQICTRMETSVNSARFFNRLQSNLNRHRIFRNTTKTCAGSSGSIYGISPVPRWTCEVRSPRQETHR